MELRVPVRLLSTALANKKTKHLRLFAAAKLLHNSRVSIDELIEELDFHPKTGKRLINQIVSDGWAGTDGKFLFPRAWHRLKYSKRGGLYVTTSETLSDSKRFEVLCFAMALKRLYRRKRSPRAKIGSASPKDFSLRYIAKALGLKERRCISLRSLARKYGFLSIKRTYKVLGKSNHLGALKKNLHDVPVYRVGRYSVCPGLSEITINI